MLFNGVNLGISALESMSIGNLLHRSVLVKSGAAQESKQSCVVYLIYKVCVWGGYLDFLLQ